MTRISPAHRLDRNRAAVREAVGLSDGELAGCMATVAFLGQWDDATTDSICRLLTAVRAAERRRVIEQRDTGARR